MSYYEIYALKYEATDLKVKYKWKHGKQWHFLETLSPCGFAFLNTNERKEVEKSLENGNSFRL